MENREILKENSRLRAKCNKLENTIIRQANHIRKLESKLTLKTSGQEPKDIEDIVLAAITESYPYCHKSIIVDRRKNDEYVVVRQLYQYFLREFARKTTTEIGQLTGNRDHSSVLYSLKEVPNRCLSSREYKSKFDIIEARIKSMIMSSQQYTSVVDNNEVQVIVTTKGAYTPEIIGATIS